MEITCFVPSTFAPLLAAYLTAATFSHRSKLIVAIVRVLFALALSAIFLGGAPVGQMSLLAAILLAGGLARLVLKAWLPQPTRAAPLRFIAFHGLHVVAIAAVSMTLPFDQTTSWWAGIDSSMATVFGLVPDWRLIALTVLSGLIASVVLGGRFIAELITSITKDQAGVQGVLSATSRHIGWLERAIVMFLILIGQPTGVGFLITAKSILRFGDAHEPNNRKLAEDIIIGTFLSFGWGMAIAELTSLALNHWFPRT